MLRTEAALSEFPLPVAACLDLKPSRGRLIDNMGRPDELMSIVTDNCVSRSVRDTARLMAASERTDSDAPFEMMGYVDDRLPNRLRIGVITNSLTGVEPHPDVQAGLQSTIQLCTELGHEVSETAWQFDGEEFTDNFLTLWASSAYMVATQVEAQMGQPPDDTILEVLTLGLADLFRQRGEAALGVALGVFQGAMAATQAQYNDFDVILSPTTAKPPLPIGTLDPMRPFEEHADELTTFVGYTPLNNVLGTPAMSVPLHWSEGGLPIGMHFAAWQGQEPLLLRLAYELEEARPWANRTPPIWAGSA